MATTLLQIISIALLSLTLLPGIAAYAHDDDKANLIHLSELQKGALTNMRESEEDLVAQLLQERDDNCVDKMKGCIYYVKYCKSHRHRLEGRCDRSCRYCGPPICEDKRSDCHALKVLRQCKDSKMKENCERSCGYCVRCQDSWNPGYCAYLKSYDKCHADLRMQDFCHRTCGFCKLPEPAPCMKTKFGCCWDKVTTRRKADGSDCPACRDKFKRLCQRLKKGCTSSAFVRSNCQQSCNYCPQEGAKCNDDPEKIHLCKFWSDELDFCRRNPDVMRHFCPATCGMDCAPHKPNPDMANLE